MQCLTKNVIPFVSDRRVMWEREKNFLLLSLLLQVARVTIGSKYQGSDSRSLAEKNVGSFPGRESYIFKSNRHPHFEVIQMTAVCREQHFEEPFEKVEMLVVENDVTQ